MTRSLDDAFSAAKTIYDDFVEHGESILSEEDAKIRIINRILTDSLGWEFESIRAETHHENGYSDYILLIEDRPALLIEAKRIGRVGLNTSDTSKRKYWKISGPALKEAMQGIDQAFSYSAANGIPISVVTDGDAWIVFKTFTSGDPYKEKQAVVFPSLNALIDSFEEFYEILSRSEFGRKTYNAVFDKIHNTRLLLTNPLVAPIEEDHIKLLPKSPLAFDLDAVFKAFFDRLSGDQDDEMLVECFVETRESRIADFSMEKITAGVLGNLDPKLLDIDVELATLIQANLGETDKSAAESGQTIFIVGPTGAGKTTFLNRFFRKTLSEAVRRQCVMLRINFLDATGNGDTLHSWITEQLIRGLESRCYDGGSPSWEELRGLYFDEYQKRSRGVDAKLYERDKDAFYSKFSIILEREVQENREDYLRKLLADVVKNRKKLPIIVVDNTDEFSERIKQNTFQFAQALRRHANHCLLIFPVTDKSAWSFSKTDIYGIYQSKSFFLPTPSPREVFRKRIDFIQKRVNAEQDEESARSYFAGKGIKVSIPDIRAFAKAIEEVFVEQEYTAKTLGQLTNYNIRRTLRLSQRVMTSSILKVEDLLKSYITGTAVAPNFQKFLQALMKGNYEYFRQSDQHEIFPVFSSDPELPRSPLLYLRILALLEAAYKAHSEIDKQHLTVQSIVDFFDGIGCNEAAVDNALLTLMEARLIEPYDMSNRSVDTNQKFAITNAGRIHLLLATENYVFFEQLALTTRISSSDVANQISSSIKGTGPYKSRADRVRSAFCKYLIEEDANYVNQDVKSEQYANQSELISKLMRFGSKSSARGMDHSSQSSAGVPESAVGFSRAGVVGTVDWFDLEKGYGFVEVDSEETLEDSVFIHMEQVRQAGLVSLSEGDTILCDLSTGSKGIFVSKIHEIEEHSPDARKAECQIVKFFRDRGYGFASLSENAADAYFRISVLENATNRLISVGDKFTAMVVPDSKGRGLEVREILKFED
ncbi:cold shock domain-containing protein [Nitratireductor sp. XY-223]|uniref:cold shock domain-containing protein n=1 Tax=Nitratireductor sp. XY-223 TaxID=2561926 RepID=UPI0010AA8EBC|nr:cold shock domain-containing protein [Nitratireductor sp. XY-223]